MGDYHGPGATRLRRRRRRPQVVKAQAREGSCGKALKTLVEPEYNHVIYSIFSCGTAQGQARLPNERPGCG
eukprot:scaffold58509_cov36-Phaeocystis_antarctica.AAC.2